jgi:protein-S-isoprenylcysteine O-methyltransferase Ste14
LSILVLLSGLALFVAISWAVRFHFSSESMPPGMLLVSIMSAASLGTFSFLLWRYPQNTSSLLLALLFYAVAAALFFWALRATRSAGLKLAFDPNLPGSFTKAGPYRYIRHPFYSAYVLFWLGCAIATQHAANIAFLLALTAIYGVAAHREERAFERSPFAADYAAYRQNAGLLWPKLPA